MEQSPPHEVASLTALMSAGSLDLLDTNGPELIRIMGMETVRTVVLDILSGKNLRDSTEMPIYVVYGDYYHS